MIFPYAYKDLSNPCFSSDLYIKWYVSAAVDCLLS